MISILGDIRSTHRKTQQCEISDYWIQRKAFNEREKQVTHTQKKLEWPLIYKYQYIKL